jgi:hypothetical protein
VAHSLDDYMSLFREKNISRTNRFQVVVSLPKGLLSKYNGSLREISMLVESAEVPGRSFEGLDYAPTGPGYLVPVMVRYEDWAVRFRLMDDYLVKEVMDAWMNLVIDPETNTVGFREDYIATASVSPLDLSNQAIETYELQQIYPRSVQAINVDNTSENTYQTLNVLFTYTKWT